MQAPFTGYSGEGGLLVFFALPYPWSLLHAPPYGITSSRLPARFRFSVP